MIESGLGIYGSHSKDINGTIEEAVEVSNEKEYLVWLEKSIINPNKFSFPTTIVIKIKKEERYYRGSLLDVKRLSEIDANHLLAEKKYRPSSWLKIDKTIYKDFKSVLYIHGLEEISQPKEVEGVHPPQRPIYIEFAR